MSVGKAPVEIAVLAFPEATASVVFGMYDLFVSAGRDWGMIVEGRPGGMPAFGGKIPADQIWKIIAYIATMGGMQDAGTIAGEGGASQQQNQSQPQN